MPFKIPPKSIAIKDALTIIRNTLAVVVIWVLSTMLAIVLGNMEVRIENLLLIYVVGVVLCSIETRSMYWGAGSAVIYLFTFNFLFTAPKYTLRVEDANYIISQLIFIVVALIAASLTVKLQRQTDIANARADIMAKLNKIGSGFLNLSGIPALEEYGRDSLTELTGKQTDIFIRTQDDHEFADPLAEWCFHNCKACGHGQARFEDANRLYIPVRNSRRSYGVVSLDCSEGEPGYEERAYVDTLISQITLVLQREQMGQEKEKARIQIEKERLKSTLLRSISHDLRTPLTGIAGNANFLAENYEAADRETVISMLRDICTEAEWLNSMVENLLNMTRIQENRLDIRKKKEVVDDLISGAASLVSKRLGSHCLKTVMPQEIVLVPVDGRLFTQVLVNLIDNAVRHSGENSEITVTAQANAGAVCFFVEDNGTGIREDKLDKIFDSFFTTAYENGDRQRGVGLGLGICQAIVEAHGGRIMAYNNETGGATFRVDIPMEENNI